MSNMEENDTRRDEECWYLLGECCKICPRLGNIEEPSHGKLKLAKSCSQTQVSVHESRGGGGGS